MYPVGPTGLGVSVERAALPAGGALESHTHGAPHLCLVLAGGFEEQTGGPARWCGKGVIRFSPAGDRHDLRLGPDGVRCLVLELPSGLAEEMGIRLPERRRYFDGPRSRAIAIDLTRAAREEASGGLLLECALLETLARAARNHCCGDLAHVPPWLRRLHDRLTEEAAAIPSFRLAARAEGIHPVYAARAFRAHYGCSPGEFARRARLARAVRALRLGKESIAVIAAVHGFSDQAHLTRWVRRALGTTPARLRRRQVSGVQDIGLACR
jgi:AraC family transcriptional regulator